MMEFFTWLAVGVLGPGALAVLVWFLHDLKEIYRAGPGTGARKRGIRRRAP